MWRLVREGLRFYGPGMLTAWAVNAAAAVVVFAVLALVGVADLRQALSWTAMAAPITLLGVSAVMGWIAIGTELGEQRLRLHVMLPLPLGGLAVARPLLPAILLLFGLAAAHAASALAAVLGLAPKPWFGPSTLTLIAAHVLLLHMLTLGGVEIAARREAGWGTLALGTLVLLVVAALDVAVLARPDGGHLLRTAAAAALAALTATFTAALFRRRPQLLR